MKVFTLWSQSFLLIRVSFMYSDGLLVGFFCEADFLQMMVHDNVNTRITVPSPLGFHWRDFHQWANHQCDPLSYWPSSLYLQAQPVLDLPMIKMVARRRWQWHWLSRSQQDATRAAMRRWGAGGKVHVALYSTIVGLFLPSDLFF